MLSVNFTRAMRGHLPGLLLLIVALVTIAGPAGAAPSAQEILASSLEVESRLPEQFRLTLDADRDAWLAQFVPAGGEPATTTDALLGITATTQPEEQWLLPSIPAWAAAAPAIDAPPPALDLLSAAGDGERKVLRLRVSSPREARVVYVVADQEVLSASVDGRLIPVYPGWRLSLVGLPGEGVELELELADTGPTRIVVVDQTDGLPSALAEAYGPEPEDSIPAILPRWARGYPTLVRRSYTFD